jgi:uncharacterized protein with ParB-like and HNH nuclease domain
MDAKPLSLGKIVSERQRFVVPIYQRTYSWTVKEQLEALFDQIEDKANERLKAGRVEFAHYMGALLLIPDGDPVFGRIQTFDIVDGQQRLTTFHLCFAALRDVARHYHFDEVATQLSDLVLHGDAVPMEDRKIERYKLQPTAYDRTIFRDLMDLASHELIQKYPDYFFKNDRIKSTAPLPLLAYWYFWEQADLFITDDGKDKDSPAVRKRLLALSTVLFEDFRLIVITLAKDDDAQVIFQTLNSGGKPLAAMDLVRNDVFHRATRTGSDEAMEERWAVFEKPFWKVEQTQGRVKKPRIDFYLAHMLAAEQGKLISLAELYSEYKRFVAIRNFPNSVSELTVLVRYISTYKILVEPTGEGALARLAKRLNVFDVSTAYPVIFAIDQSDADDTVKTALYELLASYVIRRALCGLTPKNYNNVFVELTSHLKNTGVSVQAFGAFFSSRDSISTTRFPNDVDLRSALRTRPQYHWIPRNRLRLILEELEFASRGRFNVRGPLQEGLTIEHLMPQEWTEHWPLPSGKSAPQDRQTGVDEVLRLEIDSREAQIHTLGNLFLLTPPANASAGNAGFEVKKARLRDSLLNTNIGISSKPKWDEEAILEWADTLSELGCKLWPSWKQIAS